MSEEGIPEGTTPTEQAGTPAPEFSVPDSYKEKGWAKNLKSNDDVWKMLDNAQQLAGRKAVVPDFETADEKAIDEFIGSLRPKDTSVYKFSDDMPEERREAYGKMLHEAGIPAYQANKLIESFSNIEKAEVEKMYDKDGFMNVLKESFGNDYEKIGGDTAKVIAGVVNEKDRAALEHIPNEYLGLIYRIANGMNKAYGAKETGAATEGSQTAAAVNKSEQASKLRAEIRALDGKPHSEAEKQAKVNELAALYKTGA